MKRYNNLFHKIVSYKNLLLAEKRARKNKGHRKDVKQFVKYKEELLLQLQLKLINGEYHTSEYTTFTIHEPKERVIFRLPFYPDRIVHHAIMNVLEKIWVNLMIKNTYSCIRKRGIHKAVKDIKYDMYLDQNGTKYCLKMDVTKFYPSIDHTVLKRIIRLKIKDKRLLNLLDEIIDSSDGVPIGNYLSQFFANLYLTYYDREVTQNYKIYYYRYADDIVILAMNKLILRHVLLYSFVYMKLLKLKIKQNYQIYPVESRGIDFVGYKMYHKYTLLRKSIKKNMCKTINRILNLCYIDYLQKICSYLGWLKCCDSFRLSCKIFKHKRLLLYIFPKLDVVT